MRRHRAARGADDALDLAHAGVEVVIDDRVVVVPERPELAARGEGVGSSLTSVLLFHAAETFEILGIPTDEGWNMAGCILMGYPTGRWGVAQRQPLDQVSYRNRWGAPIGLDVPEPLWPG